MMDNYFEDFIKVAPFSHALWRAGEAYALSKFTLDKSMLDIGCGFGEFAGVFFNSGVMVGVDVNSADLQVAEKRGIYGYLAAADATGLPFEDNSFSSIVSISTLEHIKDARKALEQAYRVLAPGGTFVCTVPTISLNNALLGARTFRALGLTRLSDWYINLYHKVFKHEVIVPKEQWEEWLREIGFHDITLVNTLSRKQLFFYELFLVFSLPSQIGRVLNGQRTIVGSKVRTAILKGLYKLAAPKSEAELADLNVLIAATK